MEVILTTILLCYSESVTIFLTVMTERDETLAQFQVRVQY